MNVEELKDFEKWCVEEFNQGNIKSPVHLSGGNEKELIEIFKDIKENDWVFTTYRSHYHALLKGVKPDWLKNWIKQNKSIHVMNAENKVFSSAIVGGCLPIALGVAMTIKRKDELHEYEDSSFDGEDEKIINNVPHVWCFIGDMTASLGVFNDCLTYAFHHDLPITFVIEDNGLSTDTITSDVWNFDVSQSLQELPEKVKDYVKYYKYERIYPHYGSGKFVAEIWKDIIKEDPRNKGF